MSFPANITLPVNIMAEDTDYYLLTRDKIENLKGGGDSDESTWFGACLAVCLLAVGILIPLYINATPHTLLIPFLWFMAIGSAGMTIYFHKRLTRLREERKERFEAILKKSKTVVTLASTNQSQPPSQDSSQNVGSIPSS